MRPGALGDAGGVHRNWPVSVQIPALCITLGAKVSDNPNTVGRRQAAKPSGAKRSAAEQRGSKDEAKIKRRLRVD